MRGDRRACCITRPSSRASRAAGPIPPYVSRAGCRAAAAARAGRARLSWSAAHEQSDARQPADLRSHRWFGKDDMRSFGHRSRAKQAGFSAEDIAGKPVIAILNTWSDANPCHTHFRLRAEDVKRGVWQAGGFPMEIPVLTLGETFMKPSTMLYRNLLAMDAEEALRSYPADGVVLLGGCDKTVPALLMGATSANLPAIFVPAGPMLRGNWRGQIARLGQRRVEILGREARRHARRMRLARDGGRHRALVRHLHDDGHGLDDGGGRRRAGHDAARRLVDSRRRLRASAHGRPRPAGAIVEMVWEDLKPRDILTTDGVRERRDGGDGARRIDQRDHPSRSRWPDAPARRSIWIASTRCRGARRSSRTSGRPGKFLMEDFYYAGGLRGAARSAARSAAHSTASPSTAARSARTRRRGRVQRRGDRAARSSARA